MNLSALTAYRTCSSDVHHIPKVTINRINKVMCLNQSEKYLAMQIVST